MLGKPHR